MCRDPIVKEAMLRVGIVAAEESGDLLGAGLVRALRGMHPALQCIGIGGHHLREAGVELLYSSEQLGVMGLVEVLGHLFRIGRLRRNILAYFLDNPPDIFIGVDAPDFNLALEHQLRTRRKCRTVHFVSPKIWAWRPWRIRRIRVATDLVLSIFPFEERLYQQAGIKAEYVGHPLADILPRHPDRAAARQALGLSESGLVLGLLPGSRKSEVERLAPVFLQAAQSLVQVLPDVQFVSALPDENLMERVRALHRQNTPQLPLQIYLGQSHHVMEASDLLLLASGTATLEAMLLQRPMLVAYRVHPLTAVLARFLNNAQWISLPNILGQEALVPECLQEDCVAEKLASGVQCLLADQQGMARRMARFRALGDDLRCGANLRAAQAILRLHLQG